MIRPKPLLGVATILLAAGSGIFWMTRRTPGAPPSDEVLRPYRMEVAGQGQLLELQPPPVPLRSVRWAGPLAGGAAVAQILTQTGQQQVALVQDGTPGPAFALPCPPEVPAGFFRFADLADAALVPGESLLLLYRGSNPTDPALVFAWDLRTGQVRWTHRGPGNRIALAPDGRMAFLYGGSGSVTLLEVGRPGTAKPRAASADLSPEAGEPSSLLPTGPRAFLAAHRSGLSVWRDGAWTHVAAPAPSPLGFGPARGALARAAKTVWWQPEPGLLLPLGPDGAPGAPMDLKPLLPETAALDAPLLQLLGADGDGALWFGLARPTLPAQPVPASAPDPAPEGSTTLANPAPQASQPTREAWETHLKLGLDRVYRWKPGTASMATLSWSEAWKQLTPPPGIPRPSETAGLRPEAGALLLGAPERAWWLPLKALQPR